MLEFGKQNEQVCQALPIEEREHSRLQREYVSTLIYTIVGEPFVKWVEARIKARNAKVSEQNDMNVYLDP